MLSYLGLIAAGTAILQVAAFDNSRYDNVFSYWGQNSYGATHSDSANWQKSISFYCNDNAIDVLPVAFLNVFFGPGGLPSINLANTCNPTDNATFPGTNLPDCSSLASEIKACQAKGKLVTLSLGGATGSVGFQSDDQATTFAQTIWNLFLGGSSSTRPFGSAVLDGVDLDIEGGGSDHYVTFVNKIRSLANGASKKYYITAAPQCVYPDAALSGVLNSANFDAIYGWFYNNPCGLQVYPSTNWDFGIWDNWARTISPNRNAKVYIGAPASSTAAGGGYVDINTLKNIAVTMRHSFPSFGGVMLWDASQAYANNRYDKAIKDALVAAGGTGFTFPSCSAPAWVSGQAYTQGSKAKWWSSSQPASNPNGDWSAISACSGGSVQPPSSTSSSTGPTPTSGTCSGVAAWVSSVAYQGGQQVVYNSHLWTAKWWTQGETPGGASGVWTDNGACSSSRAASANNTTSTKNSRFFRL
ncbi:carbohydrate-binding module family 5 protein [Amanita thiersii Skay4041]|uniref:chitinase n=1 Tax=Amanita thiersii Skay4041 TaxID=703135 RepID=A0A2A9NIP7_9AGAR|nr:carbohydrate-binding module family 5 protein [Amanita thiersii Skay4041]